jgi:hypothetical protein
VCCRTTSRKLGILSMKIKFPSIRPGSDLPQSQVQDQQASEPAIANDAQVSERPIVNNKHMPEHSIGDDRQVSKGTIALIASPFGLLVIATFRLLVVSNYNTTTAVTIASSNGYLSALFNSLIPLIPVFAPYLALGLLFFRRYFLCVLTFILAALITPSSRTLSTMLPFTKEYFEASGIFRTPMELLLAMVAAALIILTQNFPWMQIFIAAMMASLILLPYIFNIYPAPVPLVILVVIALMVPAYKFPRVRSIIIAVIVALILLPYIFNAYPVPAVRAYYIDVLGQMWLPAETITLSSSQVYSGYVLSSDANSYTVMLTNSKLIVYLPIHDVVSRHICQPENSPPSNPPLVPLLYRRHLPIPPCPELDIREIVKKLGIK